VRVFNRLRKRNKPQPTDRIFPKYHHAMFKRILEEASNSTRKDGLARFTARDIPNICFRLMEGAGYLHAGQELPNQRRDGQMIQKYYAAHLKDVLDASAINVRKKKPQKKAEEGSGGNPPWRTRDPALRCLNRGRSGVYSLCLKRFATYRWGHAGVAKLVDASDLSH
jgi:hypothetical protein